MNNWYNKSICVASSLSGEWWIQNGRAIYADGDIGDSNHRTIVISYVQSQYSDTENISWDMFEEDLVRNAVKEKGLDWNDPSTYSYNDIIDEELKKLGMTDEEISIARGGNEQGGDPIKYGMKVLGWKRVKGDSIETYSLTRDDLSDIISGINNIAESSGIESEEDFTVDIEVNANSTIFIDVPYSVLSQKDPSLLYQYRRKLHGGGFQLANTIKKKDIKASFLNKCLEAQKAREKPYYVVTTVNDEYVPIQSLRDKIEWESSPKDARDTFLAKYTFLREKQQAGFPIDVQVDTVVLQQALQNQQAEIARKQHKEEQIPDMWWNKY